MLAVCHRREINRSTETHEKALKCYKLLPLEKNQMISKFALIHLIPLMIATTAETVSVS
jgi:hypothetical protein